MPVFNNVLAGAAGSGGAAAFKIERSLRFNNDDSAYLNRTPSSAGNRTTWTWSGWVKRGAISTRQMIFGNITSNGNGPGLNVEFQADDTIQIGDYNNGFQTQKVTTQVFRDPSAFYHIVISYDTTNATADDRVRLYVNGTRVTSFSTNTNPSQNFDGYFNTAQQHAIGTSGALGSLYLSAYIAEVHFVDGTALAASDFGEFSTDTGVWNPTKFTGSYGEGLTTSQATGALPIHNTTDSYGAVKGSGTRSDSSSSNIELAVAMDGTNGGTTFTDEHATIKGSGSAVALTAVGNVQTVTSQNKFYGSSASFDGSGDYLSFTNIDLQRSNFTYEAWVYATDTTKLLPTVIFTAGFSSGVIHSFGLANSSGSINAVFGASTRPSSGNYYFQAPAITANKWNHIAWVRNGTTISIYVNGVGQTLDTTNGGNGGRDEVTNVSSIGTNDANEDFSGYIQDARVYSTNKYTADFTVAGISNSFHLNFSDNSSNAALGTDNSGKSNTWTVNNFTALTSGPTITSVKAYSVYDGASVSSNYTVDYSDDGSNWTNAFSGVMDNGSSCGIFSGTNPGNGSYGAHKYWRYVVGSVVTSHHPRVSRIMLSDGTTDYEIASFNADNCTDTGGIPGANTTYSYTFDGSSTDSLLDSPTSYEADSGNNGGNYATLNPLLSPANTLSNGNLDATAGGNNQVTLATFGIPASGKWYFEFTDVDSTTGAFITGVGTPDVDRSLYLGRYENGWGYQTHATNAGYYNNNNFVASGVNVHGNNTVVGIAIDRDSNKLWFSVNGTFVNSGDPANGTNANYTNLPSTGFLLPGASSATGLKFIFNAGQRPFAYTPPTGYKSLCTQNFDDPTIVDPSTAFDIDTYTGTGSTHERSELSFSPDLVWIKQRSTTRNNLLFDTARGPNKFAVSNSPGTPGTGSGMVTSFDNDGFTLGNSDDVNANTGTFVAWCWDAGSTTDTNNTAGSITPTGVKANQTAGFSIVTWTGSTQSAATVGHGLGKQPELIIAKTYDGSGNWYVFEPSLDTGGTISKALYLNDTVSKQTVSGVWGSWTEMTSTTFGIYDTSGSYTNDGDMIAYCFTSVDQFSSFGSYTGNGLADGPFVYTGFRPAFVLTKASSGSGNWQIIDSARSDFNLADDKLWPSQNYEENSATLGGASADNIDILSNGFKLRTSNAGTNASSVAYIYAAFAENPLKYARAR